MVSYANGKLSKIDYLTDLKPRELKKMRIFQGWNIWGKFYTLLYEFTYRRYRDIKSNEIFIERTQRGILKAT